MAKGFEEKVLNKLDLIDKRVDSIDRRLHGVEQEVRSIGVRQDEMEGKIDTVIEIGTAQREL